MRIIPLVLTALALAGCPEMTKHVPDDALADVPPEQVEGLAALDRQIAELDDRIAVHEQRVRRGEENLNVEEGRYDALEDRLEAENRLKKTAVESGDAAAAETSDQNRAQIRARMETSRADRDAAAVLLRDENAELKTLKAERDYRKAELELARAIAVSGERDIDVEMYRRQAEEAQLRWQQAQRARDQQKGQEAPMAP